MHAVCTCLHPLLPVACAGVAGSGTDLRTLTYSTTQRQVSFGGWSREIPPSLQFSSPKMLCSFSLNIYYGWMDHLSHQGQVGWVKCIKRKTNNLRTGGNIGAGWKSSQGRSTPPMPCLALPFAHKTTSHHPTHSMKDNYACLALSTTITTSPPFHHHHHYRLTCLPATSPEPGDQTGKTHVMAKNSIPGRKDCNPQWCVRLFHVCL